TVRNMYLENKPSVSDLSHAIDSLWSYSFEGQGSETTSIFPDGSVDLIFKQHQGKVELLLCGVMNQYRKVTHHHGDKLYGLRFKPGYAWAFINQPVHHTLNKLSVLETYFNSQVFDNLDFEALDLEKFDNIIQDALYAKVGFQRLKQLNSQAELLNTVVYGNVSDVAALQGYSRRNFLRRFKMMYGLSPRDFANIKRLNDFRTYHQSFGDMPLSILSIELGYYDQAHMTRSIKQLTGLTPQVLLSQSYNT
ncbi:MAG: AraC family transcriptional regulator, partial [Ghiorsea sp.]|nr:AraC family transcriptional regulator [Ghiorsea sp.]